MPRGIKKEWENIRRRPCANCGKPFKPGRPEARFCKKLCRQQYNRYGGALAVLRQQLDKILTLKLAPILERLAKLEADSAAE